MMPGACTGRMKQGWRLFCPPTTENMTYDIALENIQSALTRTFMPGVGCCVEGVQSCAVE